MASEEGRTDTDLDSVDLAHTTQIAKKAENVAAADVMRVDIEYGSFASSSEDPIEELVIQASATEEERVREYDNNINNDYDINSERASDDASFLVAMESHARRENQILKKLLRAPRYFDYPESTWLACNGLSEDDDEDTANEGHKSCYICGDIDHSGNHCKKVHACIICSGKGHLVKDCPNKNVELDTTPTPCLRCGNTDHDMFLCTYNYDSEDLKAIECYICKQAGHLCCLDNKEGGPNEASCYRCGQSGHFGPECTKSNITTFDLQLFCHKCKERGHLQKQCPRGKVRSAKKVERTKLFFARSRRRKKPEQTPTPLLAGAASYSGSTQTASHNDAAMQTTRLNMLDSHQV